MATINYKDPITNTWKEIPIGGPEIDSSLSSTSTNPVQNKVINSALDNKVNKTTTVNGHSLSSNVTITKSDISLGNVDNTSDLNKPISTATQSALDNKQKLYSNLTKIYDMTLENSSYSYFVVNIPELTTLEQGMTITVKCLANWIAPDALRRTTKDI